MLSYGYRKLKDTKDGDKYAVEATRVGANYAEARNNAVSASKVIFENLLHIHSSLKPKATTKTHPDETFVGICRIGRELRADEAEIKTFHALVDTQAALKSIICNLRCTRYAIQRPSGLEYVVLNQSLRDIGFAMEKVEHICKRLDYAWDLRKVRGNHLLKPGFVADTLSELYNMFFALHLIRPEDVVEVDNEGCLQMAQYSLIEAICVIQEFAYTQNKNSTSDEQLGARSWAASLRRAITLVANTALMAASRTAYTEYELMQLDAALIVRVAGLASEYTPGKFVQAVTVLVGNLVNRFYAEAYVVKERAQSDAGCESLASVSITSACIAKHALGMYHAYMSNSVPGEKKVSICRSYFEKAVVCEIWLYAKAAMCTIENKNDVPILVSRIKNIIDLCVLIHDLHVEREKITLHPEAHKRKKRQNSSAEDLSKGMVYKIRCICANIACLTIHHKDHLSGRAFRYIGGVVVCALKALDIFSGMTAVRRSYWISDDYDVLRVFPGEVSDNTRVLHDSASLKLTPLRLIEVAYGNDLHKYINDAYSVDVLPAIRTAASSLKSPIASTFSNVRVFGKGASRDVNIFQR